MYKTKKRSFVAAIAVLACLLVLVFSLGIMTACGGDSASTDGPAASTQWYYGTTAPAENLGTAGDHYLDMESLRAYVRAANGQWEPTDLYSGSTAPDNANGNTGDLYLNTESGVLYQKGESLWAIVLTVKGEKGRDGVMWFSGNQDPNELSADDAAVKDALAGDFYIDYSTFKIYQLGANDTWNELGTIKGDPGEDSVHFYDGDGAPADNETLTNVQDGDLYIGKFYGIDGKGAGSRLYRYNAEKAEWVVLMDTVQEKEIAIYTLEQLEAFAEGVVANNGYAGKEVHLKSDIHFVAGSSYHRAAPLAADGAWQPIGTSEVPFKGTFDGEGHTIYNFNASAAAGEKVGFFGSVEGATIEHLHFVDATVTASGEGSYAGVVVGEVVKATAEERTSIIDVTVTGSSVEATDKDAKVGGLVGNAAGSVTVENVEVDAGQDLQDGSEKQALVGEGDGNLTLEGTNEVTKQLHEGFAEKRSMNGEETSTMYEISSLEGLKYFRDSVNGTLETGEKPNNYSGKDVVLVANIDLNNEPWLPIGCYRRQYPDSSPNKEQLPFEGNFDGGNHTISNLTMYALEDGWGGDNYYGLFGLTKKPSEGTQEIKNLTIINVDMPAPKNYDPDDPYTFHGNHNNVNYLGALVGLATGTSFSNVHLKGSVYLRAKSNVGGLIGLLEPDTSSVLNDLSVESDGVIWATYQAGGIIGSVNDSNNGTSTLELNKIKVSGVAVRAQTNLLGGVVGSLETSSSSKTISVTIDGVQLDGVRVQPYNISSDNAKKTVGVVVGGYEKEVTSVTIKNVTGTAIVENDPDRPNDAHAIMLNDGIIGKNTGNEEESHVTIENCDELNITWYGLSHNLAEKTWSVSNMDSLLTFANLVNGGYNFEGETVLLDCDVDFKGAEFKTIGDHQHQFGGTFDGQGNTISDFSLALNGRDTGLFGCVQGTPEAYAMVKDLNLDKVVDNVEYYASFACVGAVAAEAYNADFENIHVTNFSMRAMSNYAGGLIGYVNGGNIKNCSLEATNVLATGAYGIPQFGGLVGHFENGTIDGCRTKLNGSGLAFSNMAGLVCVVTGNAEIKNCYVDFTLTESGNPMMVGGLVQQVSGHTLNNDYTVTIKDSYVKVNFTGGYYKGEHRNIYGGEDVKSGLAGLVALGCGVTISNCFVDGDVPGGKIILSNCNGDYNTIEMPTIERCSWSAETTSYGYYGYQAGQGNYLYGTVTKDVTCTFTAGMTYDAFLDAVKSLNG